MITCRSASSIIISSLVHGRILHLGVGPYHRLWIILFVHWYSLVKTPNWRSNRTFVDSSTYIKGHPIYNTHMTMGTTTNVRYSRNALLYTLYCSVVYSPPSNHNDNTWCLPHLTRLTWVERSPLPWNQYSTKWLYWHQQPICSYLYRLSICPTCHSIWFGTQISNTKQFT